MLLLKLLRDGSAGVNRATFPRDLSPGRAEADAVKRSTFLHVAFLSVLGFLFTGAAQAADPEVVIKTSLGSITVQLDPEHAPKTVANFLHYVDKKAYDGTIFHRVIPGFMVQGGGFKPDMTEISYDAPVVNEAATSGLKNLRGTISMARTNDPDSATAQFFLNLVDNSMLDPNDQNPAGYAVFGKIVDGLGVIDKIAQIPTTTVNGMGDVPTTTVMIESIRRK
jgi:cyclophilin family peptidyl-prolyl cis-trans isomerase